MGRRRRGEAWIRHPRQIITWPPIILAARIRGGGGGRTYRTEWGSRWEIPPLPPPIRLICVSQQQQSVTTWPLLLSLRDEKLGRALGALIVLGNTYIIERAVSHEDNIKNNNSQVHDPTYHTYALRALPLFRLSQHLCTRCCCCWNYGYCCWDTKFTKP